MIMYDKKNQLTVLVAGHIGYAIEGSEAYISTQLPSKWKSA